MLCRVLVGIAAAEAANREDHGEDADVDADEFIAAPGMFRDPRRGSVPPMPCSDAPRLVLTTPSDDAILRRLPRESAPAADPCDRWRGRRRRAGTKSGRRSQAHAPEFRRRSQTLEDHHQGAERVAVGGDNDVLALSDLGPDGAIVIRLNSRQCVLEAFAARRRDVIGSPPELHLRFAPFMSRLVLVEAGQLAVVAFIQCGDRG